MTSAATPSLNLVGEAEWQRFKQHLELTDQFALIFILSDRPGVVACFRERLAAIYRTRVTGLAIPVPQTPDALLSDLLPRLLRPTLYQQAIDAPIWLDLTLTPAAAASADQTPAAGPVAAWREARLAFLMRLNEQREALRRTLTRPLILILPREEKAALRTLCPDLWAIRQFAVETGGWLAAAAVPEASVIASRPPGQAPEPFPLTMAETSLVSEWQRLRERGGGDHGALLAAERAYEALMRRSWLDKATEIAAWMVKTARAAGETPEALRDLSVSLDNLGGTDQALGDWEAARAAYREGLEIGERLAAVLPNHVDYRGLPDWFRKRLAGLDAPAAA